MSETITFTIDGVEVTGQPGQSIMQSADAAGIYIPRLCAMEGLSVFGGCRVCIVLVNGRHQSACTQPIAEGMTVENASDEIMTLRGDIIDMLFVEGNHFCMFCEKSGNCELQALAYRFGILAPKFPYQFPDRDVDASHADIFIDRNRCVLCGRCVRASQELDGKGVFGFVGRGVDKKVGVNAEARLARTNADVVDKAVEACPVGALLAKRTAYRVPIGQRKYDHKPIGSDIEQAAAPE